TIHCHGNAGNLSQRGESIRRWQELLDQAVLIFDYPGYGRSGGKPSEAGCYAAADAAYDWLVQKRVPAQRILPYGRSPGRPAGPSFVAAGGAGSCPGSGPPGAGPAKWSG